MTVISALAAALGISPLRLLIYAGIAFAVITGAVALRQHYVNAGWDKALEAVKAQDATAKEAAGRAQRTVDDCYDHNGTWSVITGSCTLEGAKP
jgi:hypothetical protein